MPLVDRRFQQQEKGRVPARPAAMAARVKTGDKPNKQTNKWRYLLESTCSAIGACTHSEKGEQG
jgi:hypothetical protein